MIELIERKREIAEVNTLSPLTWAYVGDCIYELYIRTDLVNKTKLKPHKLHIETIKYVTADNIILSAKNNNKKINNIFSFIKSLNLILIDTPVPFLFQFDLLVLILRASFLIF